MVVDHIGARLTPARSSDRRGWRGRDSGAVLVLRARALLSLLVLACLSACATGPKRPPVGTLEPDKFLWERGTAELNQKHWLTAREYFRQLMDSYPQSTYRADAKLGLADTFLGEGSLESNVLAINEYREFLSFYPTHARADYAQYKLGMAHFYQMHGPERDQTETKEAIAELTLFLRRYPKSLLVPEARGHLRTARDRLSDSEYGVAYFYVRTQKYPPAAIDRFMTLLKDDPEYSRRDAVYFYLAQSLLKMGRSAEALPYLDRLVAEFEQSEYLEDAKKLATTLKADMTKKAKNGSM
jgi:outer membrane protein assembly factor BamD